MRSKSFYAFAQTRKGPKISDPITKLADDISMDDQFPKFSHDYDEVSTYLEDYAFYVGNMDNFDELWRLYIENT